LNTNTKKPGTQKKNVPNQLSRAVTDYDDGQSSFGFNKTIAEKYNILTVANTSTVQHLEERIAFDNITKSSLINWLLQSSWLYFINTIDLIAYTWETIHLLLYYINK
jgi:hypothetical protein